MTTEATVKELIKSAVNAANLVAYQKNNEILFGKVSFSAISKNKNVYRLMHTIGSIPAQVIEDDDGEKLLDDAFRNVEAYGMKLVIVVGSKAMPY